MILCLLTALFLSNGVSTVEKMAISEFVPRTVSIIWLKVSVKYKWFKDKKR